jgi:hypothetical protein
MPGNMLERLGEDPLKSGIVAIFVEYARTGIRPIQDVVNMAAQRDSQWSSHKREL